MSERSAPAGACRRADLLWALAEGGEPLAEAIASLLGYVEQPRIVGALW